MKGSPQCAYTMEMSQSNRGYKSQMPVRLSGVPKRQAFRACAEPWRRVGEVKLIFTRVIVWQRKQMSEEAASPFTCTFDDISQHHFIPKHAVIYRRIFDQPRCNCLDRTYWVPRVVNTSLHFSGPVDLVFPVSGLGTSTKLSRRISLPSDVMSKPTSSRIPRFPLRV